MANTDLLDVGQFLQFFANFVATNVLQVNAKQCTKSNKEDISTQ